MVNDNCIRGYATPEGTRRYAERMAEQGVSPDHFRPGVDGLHFSSLGVGTYLGNMDADTDAKVTHAVVKSVESGGVNVLDTAINYRYQLAERSVGQALVQLMEQGIGRDELFVCSKNGYISPDAHQQEDFKAYFMREYLESRKISPTDIAGGVHCMAPTFLEDQLERSLENLGLETLDLMYLHNGAESQLPVVGPEGFGERLRSAFEYYESARDAGKIRYYGLATWDCFRVPPDSPGYLSLKDVMELARSVGGEHHGMRFVQLPLNFAFTEAGSQPYQILEGKEVTFLEAAIAYGLGVFTSVPLLQGGLLSQNNLPTFPDLESPAQYCLQFARSYPGVTAPLVGHKDPIHVDDNLKVAQVPPLALHDLESILAATV